MRATERTRMATTFRQEDIDDLFTDLKVLGQIRPCDRMATRGAQMRIDADCALQGVYRWMHGESREATQRGIKRVLSQVNAILDLSMVSPANDQKRQILERLHAEMENTARGLTHLCATYENDVTMVSAINVHVENIQRKRRDVARFLGIPENDDKKEAEDSVRDDRSYAQAAAAAAAQ